MSTEVEIKAINSGDGQQFDVKDLPAIIGDQVDKLNELDLSVKNAIRSANKAESAAKSAHGKSAGFGKKKEAIEELQDAGLELATAVQSSAEAQKISFEFQRKLADITKFLFQLGTSNIASNRFVVRELELRLKGASTEQISDLARQEIQSVLRQLKEQEDILNRQQEINEKLKEHNSIIAEHNSTIAEHKNALNRANQELKEKKKIDEEQSLQIEKALIISGKHDAVLKEKERVDAEQHRRLKELAKLLSTKDNVDQKQEESIKKNSDAIQMLFDYTKQKDEIDTKQQHEIDMLKNTKGINSISLLIITLLISLASIVLSIISLIK